MKTKPPTAASLAMAGTRYHENWQLVTWHPRGVLDDALADRIVDFVRSEEEIIGKPFHRYTSLAGLDRVNLGLDHVFNIARRRRKEYRGARVKSAIYAVRLISLTIAGMYRELMQESAIEVGVFRDQAAAAAWLEVPEEILHPPNNPDALP